jgi:hypothetical protein
MLYGDPATAFPFLRVIASIWYLGKRYYNEAEVSEKSTKVKDMKGVINASSTQVKVVEFVFGIKKVNSQRKSNRGSKCTYLLNTP